MECTECQKPRVLYMKNKPSSRQQLDLAVLISDSDYSCGAPLVLQESPLYDKIHVRHSITCGNLVETAYYSSKLGRSDICAHCARPAGKLLADLKSRFKTVLPICQNCQSKGLKAPCQRPYGSTKK